MGEEDMQRDQLQLKVEEEMDVMIRRRTAIAGGGRFGSWGG